MGTRYNKEREAAMLQKFVLKIVLLVSVALFATTNAMAESQHESLKISSVT